jgi:RNA recognition motif-containing protein
LLQDGEGRGKGGAFVDFARPVGPETLRLDGALRVKGRAMRVELAKSKPKPRPAPGAKGDEDEQAAEPQNKRAKREEAEEGPKEAYDDSQTLFVGSLPTGATEAQLRSAFPGVARVRLPVGRDGSHRGRAYLDFESKEARDAALALAEPRVLGLAVVLSEPKPREKGKSLKVPVAAAPNTAAAVAVAASAPVKATALMPPSLSRMQKRQRVNLKPE